MNSIDSSHVETSQELDYTLEIITREDFCHELIQYLVNSCNYLLLDCEGVKLGANGLLTLVQIATPNNQVFLIDMMSEKNLFPHIRTLFESNILKVMHDCRGDVANLVQYGIRPSNIFDTQVAFNFIEPQFKRSIPKKNLGLNDLCEVYGLQTNNLKDKINAIYKFHPRFWERRPMTNEMITYAADDVILLSKLYPILKEKIHEYDKFKKRVEGRMFEKCKDYKHKRHYKSRRKNRKWSVPINFDCIHILGRKKNAIDIGNSLIIQEDIYPISLSGIRDNSSSFRFQRITNVQIATLKHDVYIFDVSCLGIIEGIRQILSSSKLKVTGDSKENWDVFCKQFNVSCENLVHLPHPIQSRGLQHKYKKSYWKLRPFTLEMKFDAGRDVIAVLMDYQTKYSKSNSDQESTSKKLPCTNDSKR